MYSTFHAKQCSSKCLNKYCTVKTPLKLIFIHKMLCCTFKFFTFTHSTWFLPRTILWKFPESLVISPVQTGSLWLAWTWQPVAVSSPPTLMSHSAPWVWRTGTAWGSGWRSRCLGKATAASTSSLETSWAWFPSATWSSLWTKNWSVPSHGDWGHATNRIF